MTVARMRTRMMALARTRMTLARMRTRIVEDEDGEDEDGEDEDDEDKASKGKGKKNSRDPSQFSRKRKVESFDESEGEVETNIDKELRWHPSQNAKKVKLFIDSEDDSSTSESEMTRGEDPQTKALRGIFMEMLYPSKYDIKEEMRKKGFEQLDLEKAAVKIANFRSQVNLKIKHCADKLK